MTAHASSVHFPARQFPGTDAPSLGSRLLGWITTARQRKADAEIREHLRSYRGPRNDEFRIELERRLAGQ